MSTTKTLSVIVIKDTTVAEADLNARLKEALDPIKADGFEIDLHEITFSDLLENPEAAAESIDDLPEEGQGLAVLVGGFESVGETFFKYMAFSELAVEIERYAMAKSMDSMVSDLSLPTLH